MFAHDLDTQAVWPDAASGEAPWPPADPGAVRLIASIRDGDGAAIDVHLRNPRAARATGADGGTPLLAAALYGDATGVFGHARIGRD